MRNRGFTLIEMIIALGIFGILLTAIMAVFMRGYATQKKIIEMQAVQRDGSYLIEILSREIRMAQNANTASNGAGTTSTSLSFLGHDGNAVTYCLSTAAGVCSSSGDSFAVNNVVVNSSDVKVANLKFYASADASNYANSEPMVTINMTLQSRKDSTATINLQTSVAMRLYSLHPGT